MFGFLCALRSAHRRRRFDGHRGRGGRGNRHDRHGHGHGADGLDGLFGGRKVSAGDLQLLLLLLLGERPCHGYELMQAIDRRSLGYYVPSPGMLYPALAHLDDTGLARVDVDGTKKRYTLTDEGRARLALQRPSADAVLGELARRGARLQAVRGAVDAAGNDADDGGGRSHRRAPEPADDGSLRSVLRRFKAALHGAAGAGEAEQQRVAAIVRRATAEIVGDDSAQPADAGRAP